MIPFSDHSCVCMWMCDDECCLDDVLLCKFCSLSPVQIMQIVVAWWLIDLISLYKLADVPWCLAGMNKSISNDFWLELCFKWISWIGPKQLNFIKEKECLFDDYFAGSPTLIQWELPLLNILLFQQQDTSPHYQNFLNIHFTIFVTNRQIQTDSRCYFCVKCSQASKTTSLEIASR